MLLKFFPLSSHQIQHFCQETTLSSMDGAWEEAQHHPQPCLTWCKGGDCTARILRLLAVSFWLDVAADVGWLWCVEPMKKVWTVWDCGSSCGARSVTHYKGSKKSMEYDFRRATQFSGFSSRVLVPSPCRLRNAPTLILHSCWRLLEPDASRRAHSYGMRSSCCQC